MSSFGHRIALFFSAMLSGLRSVSIFQFFLDCVSSMLIFAMLLSTTASIALTPQDWTVLSKPLQPLQRAELLKPFVPANESGRQASVPVSANSAAAVQPLLKSALNRVSVQAVPAVAMTQSTTTTPAPACLYALDASAQRAFYVSGSSSISSSCSVAVESNATSAFYMEGTETFNLQNHAQVGVVGGWQLSGQTKLVDSTTGQQVQPVAISSPGDPLAFLPAPTQGTVVGKSRTYYDMNSRPANNTLSAGVYCGGLTIGNTNGAVFTMSPGTYIMAGGGLVINSSAVVSGTGVTVYNTSSSGWGCSQTSSYTPITISGQANVNLSAPTSGALANVVLFGDRAGCSTVGSCQDQINGGSTTKLSGALYFKSDTLLISGNYSSSGCMTAVADKININGNSGFSVNGCSSVGGVSVSISPISASLYGGQSVQFAATVANSNNTSVIWSASAGTITNSGLYTAPANVTAQQSVIVTATSQADPTKSAYAAITLMPSVAVSISPATASLYAGQSQQLSATVSNTSNTAVNWSITPTGAGSISASGLYTAPSVVAAPQTVVVTATSQADTSKSASSVVTLVPRVAISVAPSSANIYAGQSQQFSASVNNTSNTAVTWAISPASAGTISASGLYTAPTDISKQQIVTVTATSQADSTKSASAAVTVSVPMPAITDITPVPAAANSQITITGQNFLASPGKVSLNGVVVPTALWSDTSLTLLVPTNNCTGPVTVTTQYGISNAVVLTILGTEQGCMNPVPIANAGANQTVFVGTAVQLDGAGSTSPNGTPLTYRWSIVSMPSGSGASLSDATVVNPTFVVDKPGSYTAQLIVNDTYHDSAPSQVVVSTKNTAPVANAGANQTVATQTVVLLDGSASSDVDGDALTYAWSFVSVPVGSQATLSDTTSLHPTFATDEKGTYVVQLVVNDGIVNSNPATVTISDVNTKPVASAGAAQSVEIGTTVQLNGSASTDVDGDALTYRWAILTAPNGSVSALSDANIVNPTFVADIPGMYVVQLIVNDGTVDSTPATVEITNQDVPPIANPGVGQTVAVGAVVSLDGTASTASNSNALTYLWSLLSVPSGSEAVLASTTAPNPSFTIDKYGDYIVQLIVNDGYLNSAPATVTISTTYTPPVADAGAEQKVMAGETVNLSGAASISNDGYSLTYKWSLLTKPNGSQASLSDQSSVTPSFTADISGVYVAQLIVNDTVSDSVPKTVMVTAIIPNQAPVVSAGSDQTAHQPDSVVLSGSVSDDALPVGTTLTAQWSQLSGPGTATFENSSSATTSVSFDQIGTYVLQLSASDTQYTTTSTCTVNYLSALKKPPVVSAGSDQTVPIPNNLPLQGSVTSVNTPAGAPTARWSVVSTTPAGLAATFANSSSPTTAVSLKQAGAYVLQLTGTEEELSASATVTITAQQGSQPPVVNAGPDQQIELPTSTVTLIGTASDPANGTLSVSWSQVNGPALSVINGSGASSTSVSFITPGTYTFRLTATSSASNLSASTTTHVTVFPVNQPPTVNAGHNQTVTLPVNTLQLNGVASDDGLPLGSTLAVRWTQVSGPAAVSFANSTAASTSVVFLQQGTYSLRLTGSDSKSQTYSDVTIVVNPPVGSPALTLSPVVAGPVPVGTPQVVSALLVDSAGNPIAGSSVQFTVRGVTTQSGVSATNGAGVATYSYTSTVPGTDTVQARWNSVNSNSAKITWAKFSGVISTSSVEGFFFASDESGVFNTPPTASPAFTQSFPLINFNPPTGIASEVMQVTVDGRSVPWRVGNVINTPYYITGIADGLDPSSVPVTPGQTISVKYVSGLWSVSNAPGNGYGKWDANGVPNAPGGSGNALPTANTQSLVGGFADATGQLVGTGPLFIGNSFTSVVPPGATQLLMGMNDGTAWGDNWGALAVTISFSTTPNSQVGVSTHPFTDVTADAKGDFSGTIVAQGNGLQAGATGALYAFQSVFKGAFVVPTAGNVSISVFSNAGFVLGIGGGATKVSGPSTGVPPSGLTAFTNLPVMGAYNAPQEATNTIVVSFPASGSYPYELDYACSGAGGKPVAPEQNHASLVLGFNQNIATGQTLTKPISPISGSLALSPLTSPTLAVGEAQTISATVLDASGVPVHNIPVAFAVYGVDQVEGVTNTNNDGVATYTYTGGREGTDAIQAIAVIGGTRLISNVVNAVWIAKSDTQPPIPNQPPVVSAGKDTDAAVSTPVTLNGSVADDGLPSGSALKLQWSELSGPGIAPNGYSSGRLIVIDHTKVSETDQQDFPILISGKYPYLANANYGGQLISPLGYDVIFTSDLQGTVRLDHEIDTYDPKTGAVNFWVRVPNLSTTTDTGIYMWYGNGKISTSVENIAGVWKNGYLSVYHFGDGKNVPLTDSGRAGYTLSGSPLAADGRVGGATAINSNYALIHNSVSLYPTGESAVTLEAWFKMGWSYPYQGSIFGYGANSGNGSRVALSATNSGIGMEFENMGIGRSFNYDTQWHHLVGVYGGGPLSNSNTNLFFDGMAFSTGTSTGTPAITSTQLRIGGIPPGGTGIPDFGGSVDEVRVSSVVRSPGWVATEYANQSLPSTFYSIREIPAYMGTGVVFATPNSPTTQATFSAPGTYVLQLSADDSQYTSTAETTITVHSVQRNQPPVVNAGPNQAVTLPNGASLGGTVSDDGLPRGANLSRQWSLVSGPGSVSFGGSNKPVTTASFSQPGTYVLQLSASDTQYTSTSTATIVVNAAVQTQNQPPVVEASASAVAVAGAPLTLDGTVTDDGLPNGTLVATWIQLSGPGTALFSSANSPSTQVTFNSGGSYVLQLSASDSQYTISVPLKVFVIGTPAGATNQAPFVNAGPSQQVTLGNPATLYGTVLDDSLPEGVKLKQWWRQIGGAAVGPANGFTFGQPIALDHTKVINTDQQDFPVLISGTFPFLSTVPNGGYVQNASGWDIIFTSDPTGQIRLDHEIDSYDPTTGKAGFWVRIPLLSHTADTTIYIWYGNSTIKASLESKPGVWRNGYAAVYHFGANLLGTDSTGVNSASPQQGTAQVGQVGNSIQFPSAVWNTNMLVPASQSYKPTSALTVQAWVNPSSWGNWNGIATVDYNANGSWVSPWVTWGLVLNGSSSNLQFETAVNGSLYAVVSQNTLAANLWQMVAGIYDGQQLRIFYNGRQDGNTIALTGNIDAGPSKGMSIGSQSGYTNTNTGWQGKIDELRISSVARSNDWLATEYNNQTSPSTFFILGQGAVQFTDPTAAVTQATFSMPGTYLLQLAADDSQYTSTSNVLVTVLPAQNNQQPNQPPVINAGPNQTVTLPGSITLNGSVQDDGLPAGSAVTTQWTMQSGPAAITFGNAASASTTVAFTEPGTYVLALSANDTQYTTTSLVTIVVNPLVASDRNQPPAVSATTKGPAVVGVALTLSGTVTDDGLPNGTLAVRWSQISGPGAATFMDSSSATTQVTFNVAGTYVLQLGASDTEYTSSLNLTVPVVSTSGGGTTSQPPTVSAGGNQTITLPTNTVTLNGSAWENGKQVNVAWTELTGPAPVTFANPYGATTQATFIVSGVYLLQLSANDGQYTATSTTTVVVNPAPQGGSTGPVNQPPTLKVSAPGTVLMPNNTTSFTAAVADDGLPVGSSVTLQWSQVSGPVASTIGSPTLATTQVTFTQAGNYTFQLVASDSELSSTATFAVTVQSQPGPVPVVQISLPDGTDIKSPTAISGTISSGSWTLAYTPITSTGVGAYQTLASGSGPSSGVLGILDSSNMLNGDYSVRLTTTDEWGQTAKTTSSVSVDGNLKLGAFSIAFNDLSVPLPGLPITITRTYDSRDRSRGDFGDGWRLSIANVRVQKNGGALGQSWDEELSWSGYTNLYCVQPMRNHTVSATFPDGRVYRFAATTSKACQAYGPLLATSLAFSQMPTGSGTAGAKLELLDDGEVTVDGPVPGPVNLLDYTGNYYDASQFKLTTADGYIYYLDLTKGVTKVVDTNGNALVINSDGVVSSTGTSVAFSRDSQGRISTVSDPTGALISYGYDGSGNLTSVTDRAQNQTTFEYDNNHYLKMIKDPREIPAVRSEYDDSGRLISTTDANGKTISYAPNLPANNEQITDRLGKVTLYEYDNDGNITRKTDPVGNVTSYTYDANDNKLSESVYVDGRALTTNYTYDSLGDMLTQTDPLGNTTTYTYNSRKQVLTVKDSLGHTTTNSYDGKGNLLSTTDPNGKVTSYTYNGNGTVATVTDALQGSTTFGYDGNGNVTSQVDAVGNATSFSYDGNNNKTSQTVTRTLADGSKQSLTTKYEYDGNNRLTKTTHPDGSYTEVHYNSIGKQDKTWDAKRNLTSYTYDNDGRLTSTAYADGTSDSTTYDAEGHRLSYTDRGGHLTSYTYDDAGRLTSTTYADNSTSSTAYDNAGRVASTTDRNGNSTAYAYNDAGRRTSVIDALGHTTTFAYDEAGEQKSVTDARGNTVAYTYDANGRQTRIDYADKTFSLTGYDELGRMTSKTDQAGVVTGYGYDTLGRLTSVTQDLGGLNLVTRYGYDELGNRTSQTDANNHTTRFAYDQLGRRSQRTLPMGQSESYAYEANGNLSSKTDFNGRTTTYSYDAANRLLSKTADPYFVMNQLGAAQVNYTYTASGKRQSMTDASGTTTYTYDPQTDRLTSKQTLFGTISYTYDVAGNVTSISSSNANGAAAAYQYDKLNRLATVTVAGQVPTVYSYDEVGNLAGYVYPNGVSTSFTYDKLNRLTDMSSVAKGSPVASYAYTLGASGNRTSVAELSGHTVNYTYDNLYRLTSETIAGDAAGMNGALGYTYDAVGNRKQMNSTLAAIPAGLWQYDANDRFSGITADQYDDNGNTIIGSAGATNAYDFENHLIQHGGMTFVYDGDGNRVAKAIGGVTTDYLVDTVNPTGYAQVLDELVNSNVARSYTWGLQLVSKLETGNSKLSFYGFDGHGSVRQLFDDLGVITDTYDYDAFGNLISSTGTTVNNYRFAGEQFDPDLGLYYNRARYLDVRVGRFWGMDTDEGNGNDPATLHKYLYAGNNPIDQVDPSGNDFASFAISTAVYATIGAMSSVAINGVTNYVQGRPIFQGAGGAAAFGAAALPLSVAFPAVGLVLGGLGIAGSGITAWNVFSSSNSSAGQKGAAAFLVGLSVVGAYAAASNAGANSLWVNVKYPMTGLIFGTPTGSMSAGLEAIQGRIAGFSEVLQTMPRQQQNGITVAVGIARDAGGTLRTMIGTSEPRGYIRAPMRGLLQPDDIVVKGSGHAEADIVSYSNSQGWSLIGVGATRDICPGCAAQIAGAGADAATPKQ